jgi:hypothetical protein
MRKNSMRISPKICIEIGKGRKIRNIGRETTNKTDLSDFSIDRIFTKHKAFPITDNLGDCNVPGFNIAQ